MPGLQVVGEAASGEEVVALLDTVEADIILMDLVLPGISGADATRIIGERHPNTRVIILTSFLDSPHVLPAIRSGAAGYLLKDILPDDLAQAISAVFNGQSVMHPKSSRDRLEPRRRSPVRDPPDQNAERACHRR